MGNTARKTGKSCIPGLILSALFALVSLVLFWLTDSSDVFKAITPLVGNVHVNIEPALMAITAVYVLSIFLMGVFRKSKPMLIILAALSCLITLTYFIPASGMKTAAIAKAFQQNGGKGVALCFESLRRIFFILIHVLLLVDMITGNRRKLKKMESLALHAALVFFVSSLLLSLFSEPAAYPSMEFTGLLYWKNFFSGLIESPLFAFSKFDISAASVFPLCEGAALLLIYCALHAVNASEPAEKPAPRRNHLEPTAKPAPRRERPSPTKKAPAPQRSVRPVARTNASEDDFAQLQSLAEMRRQGMISDQEFYRRKRELLEK